MEAGTGSPSSAMVTIEASTWMMSWRLKTHRQVVRLAAPAGCSGGLNIGCGENMTPESFFSGLIDDVRIYGRAVRP